MKTTKITKRKCTVKFTRTHITGDPKIPTQTPPFRLGIFKCQGAGGSWRLLVTLTSIRSEASNPPGPSWTGHVFHTCGFELELHTPLQGVEPRWSRHKKQSWLPALHTTDCEFTTLNRRGRAWRVAQRSNCPDSELVRKHLVTRHIRHFIRNYTPTDPRRSCDLTFTGCLHDHETRTILLARKLCHWSKCLLRY